MLAIWYSPEFVRTYKKLEPARRDEARTRIEEFRERRNHAKLRVHPLKGRMRGLHAFSVNFADRIIFEWGDGNKSAYLLDIGDHSIYE
jgi:mRNA-degrading endonuclease YafQ of YafQ-DinJ toxin-antitoxin module